MDAESYFVKLRPLGAPRFLFLDANGGESRWRLHAAIFGRRQADDIVIAIMSGGGYEAKRVPAFKTARMREVFGAADD